MKKPLVAVTIITVAMVLLTFSIIILFRPKNDSQQQAQQKEQYLLQIVDGTLTLSDGERVVKEYPEIVVSSLPYKDRQELTEGLKFDTLEHADRAVEDYDG